jgi:hypothetical protein
MDRYRQPQDHRPPREPYVDSPETHHLAMNAWQKQLDAINARSLAVNTVITGPGTKDDPITVETFESPEIEPVTSVLMQVARAFVPEEQAVQSTPDELLALIDTWVDGERRPDDGDAWVHVKRGHVVFELQSARPARMRLRHVGKDTRTTTVKKGHFLKGYVRLESLRHQQALRTATAEQLNTAVAEAVAS